MTQFLIRGGDLLDPEQSQLLGRHDVFIENGIIREVSANPVDAGDAQVIGARGLTVMPGLLASTNRKTTLSASLRAAHKKLVAASASKTKRLVPFSK